MTKMLVTSLIWFEILTPPLHILKKNIIYNSEHLLTCVAIKKEESILKFQNILKWTMKQRVSLIKKIQENKEKKKIVTNSGIQ